MNKELLFKEESYRIIGACFEVYNEKGNGFIEAVYQECLALELSAASIPFVEKKRLKLFYKGIELKQVYEPDFVCFEEIIVGIKAVKNLTNEHRAQINQLSQVDGFKTWSACKFWPFRQTRTRAIR